MSTATVMLAAYIDAEAKVLAGQSVKFGERVLTRADLTAIREGRREWQAVVSKEEAAAAGKGNGYALADFSGCS